MEQQREISINRREETGKEVAKRLRRQGLVPAILYGGPAPAALSVNPKDVLKIVHGERGSQLLKLRFADNGESRTAIIRNLQFDPITDQVLHVDFQEVAMDRAITVTVTIQARGESIGVKEQGGIQETLLREIQISCLPGLIPEQIEADISGLRIGDVLVVRDLAVPTGVRILNDPGLAVATVSAPMAEEVAPAAEAVLTEPEVVAERKGKAEEEET
ncbi:MAG: 50S ribosomal protein L25 [Candidatus Methylomirabilia bacterium]